MMLDYSFIYVTCYSQIMALGAATALMVCGMKKRFKPHVCFLMLFIPKAIFSFCRYYIESYGSNIPMVIILSISFLIFDFTHIFIAFENTLQEKFIIVSFMDVFFLPILTVKQHFETRFQTNENSLLVFDNLGQLLLLIFGYTAMMAVIVIIFHFASKLLKKINFDTKAFNIFGKLAFIGYAFLEITTIVGYFEGVIIKENNLAIYFFVGAVWITVFACMYLINNYFTKKRLIREIEVLNNEKTRQYKYYTLMKAHNEEIRKIRHDLNGHFSVLESLTKAKQYDRLSDYISRLSDNYAKANSEVYTSNVTADAVICAFDEKCKKKNIKFECEGTLAANCFVDDISLTCIFSNILDSAYNACKKLSNADVFIKLSVHQKNDYIEIVCKNSNVEDKKNSVFKSKKNDSTHELEIKILNEIAESYHGTVVFNEKENEKEVIIHLINNIISNNS